MSNIIQQQQELEGPPESHSELLILPDGRIFVHNLTKTMAAVLQELNPYEDMIHPRAETFRISAQLSHELSD